MKQTIYIYITILTCCAKLSAQESLAVETNRETPLPGDEVLTSGYRIPYVGGRQSPGDSIGITWHEYQSSGTFGQRLMVDDYGQAHVNWMWMDSASTARYCAWNARYADGSYFGKIQASPSWSGYVQLDITRDENPDSQRTVICYHYDNGSGYFSWIDIDQGNLQGAWPNDPKHIDVIDHIWPRITVTSNNNILLAAADYGADILHLYLTTNYGNTWTSVADFDSCARHTHFLRASRYPGSSKVVFVWTSWISDTIASGTLDQNVWHILSTDNGVTWGNRINITDYQPYPIDSVRAYADVNAVFDKNDVLHIAWGGRRVDTNFHEKSKVFHWDESSDSITVVSSPSIYYNEPGGWWIAGSSGYPGAYHMPACESQLIVDASTNYLYCLWNGNDDYADTSALGIFNGELYASYSSDNGLTWADYVNLTNTRSPGAPAGACMDEDYMTACPYTVHDSIFITFIEDKDAGAVVQGEGEWTENPVRLWVFHKNLITGVNETRKKESTQYLVGPTIFAGPLQLPAGKIYRVFDIAGREIHTLDPAPGIYFIQVHDKIVNKVIKIK